MLIEEKNCMGFPDRCKINSCLLTLFDDTIFIYEFLTHQRRIYSTKFHLKYCGTVIQLPFLP